jgi:hypothetical protein
LWRFGLAASQIFPRVASTPREPLPWLTKGQQRSGRSCPDDGDIGEVETPSLVDAWNHLVETVIVIQYELTEQRVMYADIAKCCADFEDTAFGKNIRVTRGKVALRVADELRY